MKILIWNLNRAIEEEAVSAQMKFLKSQNADLIVLLNTTANFKLSTKRTTKSTTILPQRHDGISYQEHEVRVKMFTDYPIAQQFETYDPFTAISYRLETPLGKISFYNSIIGITGTSHELYESDLMEQYADVELLPGKRITAGEWFINITQSDDKMNVLHKEKLKALRLNWISDSTTGSTLNAAAATSIFNSMMATVRQLETQTTSKPILIEFKKHKENTQINNPLHGVKLSQIVDELVAHYGWHELGGKIRINAFNTNPSTKSALRFLRKTPWAREKVEQLYLKTFKR